jgi:hypothetical protein
MGDTRSYIFTGIASLSILLALCLVAVPIKSEPFRMGSGYIRFLAWEILISWDTEIGPRQSGQLVTREERLFPGVKYSLFEDQYFVPEDGTYDVGNVHLYEISKAYAVAPLVLLSLALLRRFFVQYRIVRRNKTGRCSVCGYDLRGGMRPICSECGSRTRA